MHFYIFNTIANMTDGGLSVMHHTKNRDLLVPEYEKLGTFSDTSTKNRGHLGKNFICCAKL